jgi:hypothetical protein
LINFVGYREKWQFEHAAIDACTMSLVGQQVISHDRANMQGKLTILAIFAMHFTLAIYALQIV